MVKARQRVGICPICKHGHKIFVCKCNKMTFTNSSASRLSRPNKETQNYLHWARKSLHSVRLSQCVLKYLLVQYLPLKFPVK